VSGRIITGNLALSTCFVDIPWRFALENLKFDIVWDLGLRAYALANYSEVCLMDWLY
jgi:hypothetical protein